MDAVLSKRPLPTDCQSDRKIFRSVLFKSASHHTPIGRHRFHEEPVSVEILGVMNKRNGIYKRDPTSHELDLIMTSRIASIYKRKKWRGLVETMEQKTVLPSCRGLLKVVEEQSHADNDAITFNRIPFLTPTSKLARHTSSNETRLVTRETLGDGT